MDTLHSVIRTIHGETKSRRDHLAVFREFLGHLDRVARRPAKGGPTKAKGAKPARRK